MQYRSTKGYNGWEQLGFFIAFLGAGFILAEASIVFIGLKALGPSILPLSEKLEAIQSALLKLENSGYAQLAQIIGVFFLMFLPAAAFILFCHAKFSWAGFNKHFSLRQILIGALIIYFSNFFASPFENLTKQVLAHFHHWDTLAKNAEDEYNSAVQSMSALHTWPQFFMGVFIIAFLPAMFEELFFRGVMQNFLVQWWKRPIIAITVTSILFSLVHASYYLFISRAILGFVLGLLFYYSKNIWVNIFAHFVNNMFALIQLFYSNITTTSKPNIDDMDPKLPFWTVVISFTVLAALFFLFDLRSKANREIITAEESAMDDHLIIN
ncbi:MAG TPA: CPBP family intramembrane glutamic endopeptidase [Ferruginibacter sp.]|nr:CPBP family intramembrane glutamic endopeptidase [Ferruginibacter sp.]